MSDELLDVHQRDPQPGGRGAPFAVGATAFTALLCSVSGLSLAAIVLALSGHFWWPGILGLGALVGTVLYWLGNRGEDKVRQFYWLAALVIAAASYLFNASQPAEHLLTGRDSGTYVATSGWLAEHGELPVEARVGGFIGADDLSYGILGFKDDRQDGRLSPKFLHTFPALMALTAQMFGLSAALRLNAALGGIALISVFALASRMMRPGIALVVEAALAVNLVFVYFSRAPFSEMFELVFIFGGLWMLQRAEESRAYSVGFGSGVVVGGAMLAHIDGLVLLVPLGIVALIDRRRSGFKRCLWKRVGVGLGLMIGIGAVDLILFDPAYIGQLRTEILAILATLTILLVVDIASRWTQVDQPLRAVVLVRLGRLVTQASVFGLVIVVAFFTYFVRPYLGKTLGHPYSLSVIQKAQGLPLEPNRTYAELAGHWLGWYLGPILVVGVFGWAIMASRVATGRQVRAAPFVLVFSAFTVLYLWRPSINPDHLWAMRRFLPVVIPGMLVCAGLALDRLLDVRRLSVWATRGMVATLAAVMVVAPLRTMMPLARAHEFDGMTTDFERACTLLGADGAVLVVDGPNATIGSRLVQGFRSYCDLPAAYVDGPIAASRLLQLSNSWSSEGRVLWVLSGDGSKGGVLLFDRVYERVELTLTQAPDSMTAFPLRVWASTVG